MGMRSEYVVDIRNYTGASRSIVRFMSRPYEREHKKNAAKQ